mmetsp:Transcript_36244/g.80654  ORF Transcript_36244/g.80654 Transcript_36244/m.80654 type:complete len:326 (-) Transcript_36244:5413-6390(-)
MVCPVLRPVKGNLGLVLLMLQHLVLCTQRHHLLLHADGSSSSSSSQLPGPAVTSLINVMLQHRNNLGMQPCPRKWGMHPGPMAPSTMMQHLHQHLQVYNLVVCSSSSSRQRRQLFPPVLGQLLNRSARHTSRAHPGGGLQGLLRHIHQRQQHNSAVARRMQLLAVQLVGHSLVMAAGHGSRQELMRCMVAAHMQGMSQPTALRRGHTALWRCCPMWASALHSHSALNQLLQPLPHTWQVRVQACCQGPPLGTLTLGTLTLRLSAGSGCWMPRGLHGAAHVQRVRTGRRQLTRCWGVSPGTSSAAPSGAGCRPCRHSRWPGKLLVC